MPVMNGYEACKQILSEYKPELIFDLFEENKLTKSIDSSTLSEKSFGLIAKEIFDDYINTESRIKTITIMVSDKSNVSYHVIASTGSVRVGALLEKDFWDLIGSENSREN